MSYYLVLILRILCVATGAFLVCSRIFMFERTQGLIQNRIEDLWIRVDDYQRTALSKHVAFMKVVSGALSTILDRNFGKRLVSLPSLIVSVCYAVATFFLAILLLMRYGRGYWDSGYVWLLLLYVAIGSAPLFFSYLPGRAIKKKLLLIWLVWSLTMAQATIVGPAYQLWKTIHESAIKWVEPFILGVYCCLAVVLALYALFIVVIRKSLRSIRTSDSIVKTPVISLLNLLPIFGLYGLIKVLSLKLDHSQLDPALDYKDPTVIQNAFASWSTRFDMFLVFLLVAFFLFDLIFVFTAIVFAALSLVMFLHRLFWPALSRLLYALQRFRIVSSGMVLVYLGSLLILLGIGRLSWLQHLVKLF